MFPGRAHYHTQPRYSRPLGGYCSETFMRSHHIPSLSSPKQLHSSRQSRRYIMPLLYPCPTLNICLFFAKLFVKVRTSYHPSFSCLTIFYEIGEAAQHCSLSFERRNEHQMNDRTPTNTTSLDSKDLITLQGVQQVSPEHDIHHKKERTSNSNCPSSNPFRTSLPCSLSCTY